MHDYVKLFIIIILWIMMWGWGQAHTCNGVYVEAWEQLYRIGYLLYLYGF